MGTPTFGRAQYVPGRLEYFWPNDTALHATPENGYILGQIYDDPVQWVQIAANSDRFAVATVESYCNLLVRKAPSSDDAEEFGMLWTRLKNEHD